MLTDYGVYITDYNKKKLKKIIAKLISFLRSESKIHMYLLIIVVHVILWVKTQQVYYLLNLYSLLNLVHYSQLYIKFIIIKTIKF